MIATGAFPWLRAAVIGAVAVGALLAPSPVREVSIGTLALYAVTLEWMVSRFPIRVADTVAMAEMAVQTREHLDEFVQEIAKTAADAVAVVREYDAEAAEELEARVGSAFRSWADE